MKRARQRSHLLFGMRFRRIALTGWNRVLRDIGLRFERTA